MSTGYRFLVADDHPLFRGALKEALAGLEEPCEMLETGDFDGVKRLFDGGVDLVLLDLSMPGVSGLSGLVTLRGMNPAVPVAVVSAYDDAETIRRALDLGASGFISKSAGMAEIRRAVRVIVEGGVYMPDHIELGTESDPEIADLIRRIQMLTPQQARVLGMLADGLLNKQIAYALNVSEATVKAHVSAVLQKLEVDSRTQAVIRLSRIGADAIATDAVSAEG